MRNALWTPQAKFLVKPVQKPLGRTFFPIYGLKSREEWVSHERKLSMFLKQTCACLKLIDVLKALNATVTYFDFEYAIINVVL